MNNLYKGPKFYEESDKDIFYGRDKETQKLYYLVENSDFCVCYAESGEGKSSIINAGLSPKLRVNDFLPVRIVLSDDNFNTDLEEDELDDLVWTAIERAVNKENESTAKQYRNIILYPLSTSESDNAVHEKLGWKLRNTELRGDSFHKITPVIIFDQFEEVFSKAKDISWTNTFFHWLENLYDDSAYNAYSENQQKQFKVLLSMRSDYISELDYWAMDKYFIPSLKNNRYCLKALTLNGTEEIINKLYVNKIEGISTKEILEATKTEKAGYLENNDKSIPCISALALSLIITCIEEAKSGIQKIIKDFEKNEYTTNVLFDKILEFYYNTSIKECGITKSEQETLESALVDIKGFRKRVSIEDADISNIEKDKLEKLEQKRIIHKSNKYVELSHDSLKGIISANNQKREETRDNGLYASLATILFIFATLFSYKFLFFEASKLQYIYATNLPNTFCEWVNLIFAKHFWIISGNISIISAYISLPFLVFLKFRRKLMCTVSYTLSIITLLSFGVTTFLIPTPLNFLPYTICTTIIIVCTYAYHSSYFKKERLTQNTYSKNFEFSKWSHIRFNNVAIGLSMLLLFALLALNYKNDDYYIITGYILYLTPIPLACLSWGLLPLNSQLKYKNYRFISFVIFFTVFSRTFIFTGIAISISNISYCFLLLSLLFGFIHFILSKQNIHIKSSIAITHCFLIWLSIGLITNIWNPFINFGEGKFYATTKKCMLKKTGTIYGIYTNSMDTIFEHIAADTITFKEWNNIKCWSIPCKPNGQIFKALQLSGYTFIMPVAAFDGKIRILNKPNLYNDIWKISKLRTIEGLTAKTFIDIMEKVAIVDPNKTIQYKSIPSLGDLYQKQDSILDSICKMPINDYPNVIHLQELLSKQAYTAIMIDALEENRREDLVNAMSYLMISYFGNLYNKNHLNISVTANINIQKYDTINFSNNSVTFKNSMLADNTTIIDRDSFYRSSNVIAMALITLQNTIHTKAMSGIITNEIQKCKNYCDSLNAYKKSIKNSEIILKGIQKQRQQMRNLLKNISHTDNSYTSKFIIDNAHRLNNVLTLAYETKNVTFTSYIQYQLFYQLCNAIPLDDRIYNNSLNILKKETDFHDEYKNNIEHLREEANKIEKDGKYLDNSILKEQEKLNFFKSIIKKFNLPIE